MLRAAGRQGGWEVWPWNPSPLRQTRWAIPVGPGSAQSSVSSSQCLDQRGRGSLSLFMWLALISWASGARVCLGLDSLRCSSPQVRETFLPGLQPRRCGASGLGEGRGQRLPGVAPAGQAWVSLDSGGCSGGGVRARSRVGKPGLPRRSVLCQTPISLEFGGLWPPRRPGDWGHGSTPPRPVPWDPSLIPGVPHRGTVRGVRGLSASCSQLGLVQARPLGSRPSPATDWS